MPLFTIFCIVGGETAGATVMVTGTAISKLVAPLLYRTSRSPDISVVLLTSGRSNVMVTVPLGLGTRGSHALNAEVC